MSYAYKIAEQKDLFSFDKNQRGDKVFIRQIIEKNGTKIIDLRNYFTDIDTGQVLPTRSGVRINDEYIKDVIASILPTMEYPDLIELKDVLDSLIEENESES